MDVGPAMPPIKLLEYANTLVMCNSKAWNVNSPDKCWWVYPNQVSKTPPTGQYVSKGSFIITGKKNYLSLPRLEMGITLLFKVKKNSELLDNFQTTFDNDS